VTKVYGEEIVVTVASENATSVTYNVTNASGAVVAQGSIDGNGTFTAPTLMLVSTL
jgi:hypothetical protein